MMAAARLGVPDLADGKYVYDGAARSGELHVIDEFFHELSTAWPPGLDSLAWTAWPAPPQAARPWR